MISQRALRAGLKELEIFDHFEIDYNLPKHKIKQKEINSSLYGTTAGESPTSRVSLNVSGGPTTQSVFVDSDEGGIVYNDPYENKFLGVKNVFKKLFSSPKKRFTILEFFTGLSKSINDLKTTSEIATYYEQALLQAKENGQTALIEKLNNLIFVCKNEANLVDMNYTKYVSERQVVDFYNKITEDKRKHLKLTWIKNFTRILPSSIVEIKKEIDEKEIFDNYVILHYDPELNSIDLTEREKEYKKDPILFGVIQKSKKLYYIADWKDEVCDLTLDEMFLTLKEKVFEINNDSVKSFINTGGTDIDNEKYNKPKKIKK